jgi:hypothetical protein
VPADGSENVPTNTQLRIFHLGDLDVSGYQGIDEAECESVTNAMRLVSGSEEPIDISGELIPQNSGYTWLLGTLATPLLPNTEYGLQLMLSPESQDACVCLNSAVVPAWTTIAKFTTGVGPDDEPPVFEGVTSFTAGQRFDTEGPCGSPTGVALIPDFVPPAAADLRYNIYVDDVLVTRYLDRVTAPDGFLGEIICGVSGGLSNATVVAPGARVEVRAVDLAGNESLATEPLLIDDELCASGTSVLPPEESPDTVQTSPSLPIEEGNDGAGPSDSNDDDPDDGNGATEHAGDPIRMPAQGSASGGCTVSAGVSHGFAPTVWTVLVALLALHRRSRRLTR